MIDLEFIKNKINEWELQKQNCPSKTVSDLLQKLLTSGKNNISNYEKILFMRNRNEEKAKKAVSNLEEVEAEVIDGRMDRYYDLTIFRSEKLAQESKDALKKRIEITPLDEITDVHKNKEFELMNDVFMELNESNKMMKQICLNKAEIILGLYKGTFKVLLFAEKILFRKYEACLRNALDFHDFGQWETFKKQTKNFLVSLNAYTGAVAQIAQFINVFDEDKNKENFYSSTEHNVLKLEQQLSALLSAEKFGEYLINYFSLNKYVFPTMSESDYEYLIQSFN